MSRKDNTYTHKCGITATWLDVEICFDMDGTLVDLYGVDNWLSMLEAEDPTPYMVARPMFRLSGLARRLNNLQKRGATITIITWTAKNSTSRYQRMVAARKREWLKKHMPSVKWDRIVIIPYGTSKAAAVDRTAAILFDDDEKVRDSWGDDWEMVAYPPNMIAEVLGRL